MLEVYGKGEMEKLRVMKILIYANFLFKFAFLSKVWLEFAEKILCTLIEKFNKIVNIFDVLSYILWIRI